MIKKIRNILIIAPHADDEVLGCGGTLLKHINEGDKVYVLFVSDGVSGRFNNNQDLKCKKEIIKRKQMAIKVAKLGKFKIVDF